MQNPEKCLIEAAQQGSVGAFEQLISQVEKNMLSLAAGLVSCPFEAEDIYQDTMLKVFKALPRFRMESQFSTWLYRILVNTAISNRRKLKNKLVHLISRDQPDFKQNNNSTTYLQNACEENPERELLNQQLSKAIDKAIERLSDKERIAFVLCHQQEFKIGDAAQVMAVSQGAVKSYLFRAREKMRLQLQDFIR